MPSHSDIYKREAARKSADRYEYAINDALVEITDAIAAADEVPPQILHARDIIENEVARLEQDRWRERADYDVKAGK